MTKQSASRALPMVPPSFFAIVLGLAGLANDWRAAHVAWSLPAAVGEVIHAAAAAAWLVIVVLYALKWIVARSVARNEAENAIQCCFIGLAGVATMLVAQGALPYSRHLAIALFSLGAAFTIGFGLWRTGILWRGGRDAASTTPVLYLPLVAGGFVTATVASALGWQDWGKLAFGAGFFGWLAIESVLLHRLYTAAPLSLTLRPALGIQLAPPAVGAACYLAIGGSHADMLLHMMIGYALLQALILTRMIGWIRQQPFSPSYWAFTFGATALAGVTIRLAIEDGGSVYVTLAPALFLIANMVVAGIAAGTIWLLLSGKLLPSSPPSTTSEPVPLPHQ
jgi:tellurite resistance protein